MKPFRERNPITVGLVGAAVMAVLGAATYFSDDLPVIGGGTSYAAEFTEAAGLKSGDEVRVAGVKVGKVTGVALDGDHVRVDFRVRDTWLGDRTTAAIKIKTLLGQKDLVLDPLGAADLDPSGPIPLDRTTAPYDVTAVFNDLARTAGRIDTAQLARSFDTIADTLGATAPADVRSAVDGLSALSTTIASRDDELAKLFANTTALSAIVGDRSAQVQSLIRNGNTLLAELNARRDAIATLFSGARALGVQLRGLVTDNQATLDPALAALDRVTDVLARNQDTLSAGLRLAGPFYRLLGNAVGNGEWIDTYICGLIPRPGSAGHCIPPDMGGR